MKITLPILASVALFALPSSALDVDDEPFIYPPACGDNQLWSSTVGACVSNECASNPCGNNERCVNVMRRCEDCDHHMCLSDSSEGCPDYYEAGPDNVCFPISCDAEDVCKPNDVCVSLSQTCPQGTLVCPQFGCSIESDENNGTPFPGTRPMPPIYPPCPQVQCDIRCAHGIKHDAFGCQTCECQPCPPGELEDENGNCYPVDCESSRACPEKDLYCVPKVMDCEFSDGTDCVAFQCVTIEEAEKDCDEHFGWDPTLNECVPVDCESKEACPNGAKCIPSKRACDSIPCKNFFCEVANDCPPICEMLCANGFVVDENGCEVCKCHSGECPHGEEFDPIHKRCQVVSCDSERACPGSKCEMADPPILCLQAPCDQTLCDKPNDLEEKECTEKECTEKCEFGVKLDGQGCATCDCRDCPKGQELDLVADPPVCVPVSCDAVNACPDADRPVCAPLELMCFRAPCPQFECLPTCHTSDFQFNPKTGACEPINCEAEGACPDDEECIAVDAECSTSPCKQYECLSSASPEAVDEEDAVPTVTKNGNSTTNETLCDEVMCDVYCENGHVKDDDGCDTCSCNTCPLGEAWVEDKCVPVTCESTRACADVSRVYCQPVNVTCTGNSTCAQFECPGCPACDDCSMFGNATVTVEGCPGCNCSSTTSLVLSANVLASLVFCAMFLV